MEQVDVELREQHGLVVYGAHELPLKQRDHHAVRRQQLRLGPQATGRETTFALQRSGFALPPR